MDLIKYDMTDIWASAGDVVAPDSTKIAQGWGVEVVPRQWWNWFENRQDNNLAYLLQKGFPEWDATTEYIINKSYVQRNGIVYKATATSTNSDPIALTSWVRAFQDYTAASNALGALTPAADRLPYFNGTGTATLTTLTSFARTLLGDTTNTAARTTLGAQASHANLTALAGVTAAVNALPYFTSTTVMGVTTLSSFGRSLIDDADATAARTTLGLTSAAITPLMVNNQDRTAGAIMQVGAFGVGKHVDLRGSVISLGTPADIYGTGTTFGFVNGGTGDANSLNIPGLSGIYYGTLQVNGQFHDASGLTAMSRVFTTLNGRTFTQTAASATTWSAWVENWTTGNLVKTASSRDTTAGRMLQVGDFGLGGSVPLADGVDLNTVVDSGFYRLNNNVNKPAVFADYGQMIVSRGQDTISQLAFSYSGPRLWTRTGNPASIGGSGVWSPWVEIYHTGNTADLSTSITNDVLAQVNPTIALKLDKADNNLSNTTIDTDPNTDIRDQFLTSHANGPLAGTYFHITQVFYASKTTSSNRAQTAVEYTGGGALPRMYIRSAYYPGGWTPWIRCDQNANTASANKLNVARTINGVAFDGTANITVPVVQLPNTVMEIGRYIDFHTTDNSQDFDVRLQSEFDPTYGWSLAVIQPGGGLGIAKSAQFVANGGWFRSIGQTGWYSETYGGGWNMTDSTWLRAYNSKSIYSPGTIQAGAFSGPGAGITGVTSVQTQCVHNSGIVEFGYVILTGANVSTVDLPSPYVMTGMRTAGVPGGHGGGYLRGVTLRTY